MTKKDYIAIASIIREAHEKHTDHAPILYITEQLANLFANDNPRFDMRRFLDACKVQS